jgi:hypothetical protein
MFRQVLALFAIGLVVSSEALAQQGPAHQVIVRKGTGLKLALLQPLDSATAKAGDDVPLRLSRPLVVNGVTLLGEGDVLHGKVTRVKRSGARCRSGEVAWELDRIPFSDGTTARSNVRFTTAAPDATVNDVLDTGEINPLVWFANSLAWLVMAPFIIISLPFMLLNYAVAAGFHGCTMPGKEFQMPANATVGVVILRDHHVSY